MLIVLLNKIIISRLFLREDFSIELQKRGFILADSAREMAILSN